MSININEVRVLLKEMVDFRELSETKWIVLKKEGKKTWALVFGWQDGFDPAKNPTPFQYENYRICGKLAYNDSAMKEYDMDWLMPCIDEASEERILFNLRIFGLDEKRYELIERYVNNRS